jgi:ribonuclease HI
VAGALVVYTDGASRGNPGPAAVGAAVYRREGTELRLIGEVSEAIGVATNNVAEYRAVIAGVTEALAHQPDHLVLRADSQLLIRQLQGSYRVKNPVLAGYYRQVRDLLAGVPHRLEHVPREENTVADALANAALDR